MRFLFIALLLISATHTQAAELRVVKTEGCLGPCNPYPAELYIIGTIEPGDAARVTQTIKDYGPGIWGLELRSIGGSMYNSIQIGALAKKLMLTTLAPITRDRCASEDSQNNIHNAPCTCLSGCFLIWLGGIQRIGLIIGMHRPWDTSHNMGQMPYEQAAPMYAKWMSDLQAYLKSVEVPQLYYSKLIETVSSNTMKMLSSDEVVDLAYMPSVHEWLINRCGVFSPGETNAAGREGVNRYYHRPFNAALLQSLQQKQTAIANCETNAKTSFRTTALQAIN